MQLRSFKRGAILHYFREIPNPRTGFRPIQINHLRLIPIPALANTPPPGERRGGGLPLSQGSAKLNPPLEEAKKLAFRRAARRATDAPDSVEYFAGNHQRDGDRAETKLPIPKGHVHESSACADAQSVVWDKASHTGNDFHQ